MLVRVGKEVQALPRGVSREAARVPAIRQAVTVDADPTVAFAGFTEGIGAWWPREYTWSGPLLQRVAMEPRLGGFCYEVGTTGMRLDWGRLSVWQPPERLAFTWQVGPDRVPEPNPAHASEVQVAFRRAAGGRTRVTVIHDGWERHGEAGASYRRGFADAGGWARILGAYAAVMARREDAPWTGLTT
jgi:uncharacterized protein YndB with AHSA1/START domain